MPCDADQRRASKLVIGQTARVDLELDMISEAGISFVVEIYGILCDEKVDDDNNEEAPPEEPRKKLMGVTRTLHSNELNLKTRDSRPTAFDLQGLCVDEDLRHQAPLVLDNGRSRGHLNYSVWIEPTVDFGEDRFSDPDSLRNAVLSTADLTLVVVAKKATGLKQPDMFRKPWPFISLELQLQDPVVVSKRAAAKALEEEEAKTNHKKAKAFEKTKKTKKRPKTRGDDMWPKLSGWESYEIDSSCDPEWDDRIEFRLLDVGLPRKVGGGTATSAAAASAGEAKVRTKEGKEDHKKADSVSADPDHPSLSRSLRINANEEHAHVRVDVRVMDRDKKKVGKLASLEAPIPIKELPIQIDPPPNLEDVESSATGAAKAKQRKIKSKSALIGGASTRGDSANRKSSENEYELFSKGKPGAGTLCLDMWLRPSEAMLSAGNMVMGLFGVANALLESPLKSRWTSDVCRTNSNKVSSILGSLEGAMHDWRFAGMLKRLPGGGVSRARLDTAKEGLVAMKALVAERLEKEDREREATEEKLRAKQEAQRERERNRMRIMIERAKQGGARTRKRLHVHGGAGSNVNAQSEVSGLVLGSAHADFVEERVHGMTARAAACEMAPSQLKTFLLQPQCPDRITMMRWSLTDVSIDLLLTWASLPGVGYGNIVELDLPENNIESQGAVLISHCLHEPGCLVNLEMLNLRQNMIEDRGSRAIAEMVKTHRKLRIFDLSSNGIGKEGCMYLSQMMARNRSLRLVNVERNQRIGPEERALLLRGQRSRRTRMSALQLVAMGKKSGRNEDTLQLII
jgi:hypothetical protein